MPWNVDGAANLKTGPSAFNGSLLAPKSTLTNQDREFNGSMIVANYSGTKADTMNPVTFGGSIGGAGEDPSAVVPEPTSALIGGLLVLGLLRRQRR